MSETSLDTQQLQAVNSDHPNIIIIACAGAGKTRILTERVKRLVQDGHDPKGMVIVTYTRMAARELFERLGDIKPGYVGTLHGYMLQLCTQHHEQIGYPERISVIDKEMEEALLKQSTEEMGYRGSLNKVREAMERMMNHAN
jgi:superfamily I DNA/RNA helicase